MPQVSMVPHRLTLEKALARFLHAIAHQTNAANGIEPNLPQLGAAVLGTFHQCLGTTVYLEDYTQALQDTDNNWQYAIYSTPTPRREIFTVQVIDKSSRQLCRPLPAPSTSLWHTATANKLS